MAPIVKDAENSATTSTTSAAPSNKNPQDSTPRLQPVPLEVSVVVNGARTIEGSDKREPFSESTKTVLVFGNGAVIRLASPVAPGQLLFVTNEKSKREVVCQVVKSKTYRAVSGYVELEFTEPAANFWGVRFPTAPASPQPAAPTAAAPHTTPSPVVPAKPVATAPTVPPIASKPTVAPLPPKPPAIQPVEPTVGEAPKSTLSAPSAAPKPPVSAGKSSAISHDASLPSFLTPQAPAAPPIIPKPIVAVSKEPVSVPSPEASAASPDLSSEELKRQASKLQEQLNSLLFAGAPASNANPQTHPAALPPAPIAPPNVTAPEPVSPESAARKAENSSHVGENTVAAAQPAIPATITAVSPIISPKISATSVAEEEVKIPAWLAPLARETNAKQLLPESSTATTAGADETHLVAGDQEAAHRPQSVVFGNQLLGSTAETRESSGSPGSKKGLFLGIAAVAALAIGAAVWYGMQPGNFLASKPASVANPPAAATSAAPAANEEGMPSSTMPAAALNPPTTAASVANSPAVHQPVGAVQTPAPAVRTNAAAEQAKKPSLGDVFLASPNINRATNSTDAPESEPTIDASRPEAGADPLANMATSNRPQPTAPLPVGGEVKPAVLIKSVPPVYPASAKNQRISGNVVLDALIDATGRVSSATVVSGPRMLHQSALDAVKQWKYEPAKLDGKPTSTHLNVTVQFKVQ